MKKIGIMTIYDENNYGNRLQNYAVQEVLKSMNFQVETIKNTNLINGKNCIHNSDDVMIERKEKFLKFNEENMINTEDILFHQHIPEDFHNDYDYFVVGSDQIWNYNFENRFSDAVFLNFAPYEKRVSFSASFGVGEIPTEKYELYRELKGMKAISVRENTGVDLVKNITGRDDAVVLIDPTMMLSAEKWTTVMKKPEQLKSKKYILKYFLGDFSEEKKKEVERFAEENDCDIIDILDKNTFYGTGPSEFLYLIKNSFLVITDSFHACIFSIIFNRPFLIFERDEEGMRNMYTRIDTLLNNFELEGRKFEGKIEKLHINVNYSNAYEILAKEQEKVKEFLSKALDIKK